MMGKILLLILYLPLVSLASIRISPSDGYNFGLVTIDTSSSFTFEIKNISNFWIHICDIKLESVQNTYVYSIEPDNCKGRSLPFQESCLFTVKFYPVEKKVYTASVSILYDDDGDEKICDELKEHKLDLKGAGINIKVVKVFPEPQYFGFYYSLGEINYGERKSFIFRLCNAGGNTIYIEDVEIKNINSTLFGLNYNTCVNSALVYIPNNENCERNYCEFEVIVSSENISSVLNKVAEAYIQIKDTNGGPDNKPSGLSLFLAAKINLPTEKMYAPVGGEDVKLFKIDFFCPNDGDDTPGEVMPIGKPTYAVVGSYFHIDEAASSCPAECLEGQIQVCNVLVKFKPEAPGIYEGKVVISLPLREMGIYGREYVIQQNIIGIAGDIDTDYLKFSPEKLTFTSPSVISAEERMLNIYNSSSATIPFDVSVIGQGFGIRKIICKCNEKYYYKNGFCMPLYDVTDVIPSPEDIPTSPHPYLIEPGKVCSIVVASFKPLTVSTLEGKLIVETPLETFLVPLVIETQVVQDVPIYIPPPDVGSGGGGCKTGESYSYFLVSILVAIGRIIKNIKAS